MNRRLSELLEQAEQQVIAFIPIGIPGAGKSFLAEKLLEAKLLQAGAVVSTDSLRQTIGGGRTWLGDEAAVFRLSRELLALRLRNRLSAYYDATNLDPEKRESLLDLIYGAGGTPIYVLFPIHKSEYRERRTRQGVVYEDEIWRQLCHWAVTVELDDEINQVSSGDLLKLAETKCSS